MSRLTTQSFSAQCLVPSAKLTAPKLSARLSTKNYALRTNTATPESL